MSWTKRPATQNTIAGSQAGSAPVATKPTLLAGYLGPQPSFAKSGLSAVDHPDPSIETDSSELVITISMNEEPFHMNSQLFFASNNRRDDWSEYVLHQAKGNKLMFHIRFKRTGYYKFQLYGTPVSDTGENAPDIVYTLPSVFNYLIHCRQMSDPTPPMPFPKQSAEWKEGFCYLYEPLQGRLHSCPLKKVGFNTKVVHFKADVPKAAAVAVVFKDEWFHLKNPDGSTWEADVPLDKNWGKESKVTLCSSSAVEKVRYSTLLEYSM